VPVAEIQQAMLDKHLPLIEEAGAKGVQILCLQEIFNGPYFCPSQDKRWYDAAEPVPGPTTEPMQARQEVLMVIVVPVYEREAAGVYYNTAAVIDADGTYLGKYRKKHIPQVNPGFWEKFYFKPGNLGTRCSRPLRQGRRLHLLRPPLPRGRALPGLHGAEIVFNPSATVAGPLAVPLEARAARARRRQRLLRRRHQPRGHRGALEHRQVLRHELLRRPARAVPRRGLEDKTSWSSPTSTSTMIEEVRRRGSSTATAAPTPTAPDRRRVRRGGNPPPGRGRQPRSLPRRRRPSRRRARLIRGTRRSPCGQDRPR
jgi:hypothetical protein